MRLLSWIAIEPFRRGALGKPLFRYPLNPSLNFCTQQLVSPAVSFASPFSRFLTKLGSLSDILRPHFSSAVLNFQPSGSLGSVGTNIMEELVRSKHYEVAISVYGKMVKIDSFIDLVTLSGLLKCFARMGKTGFAFGVLGLMLKRGSVLNIHNLTILLKGLCLNRECGKAVSLLREMRQNSITPNAFTYNTVIRGFCREDEMDKALQLANEMSNCGCSWSMVTWEILIDAFCKAGKMEEAMAFLKEMEDKGVNANRVVYATLIRGFCDRGELVEGKALFNEMLKRGVSFDVITFCTLIRGYCKVGEFEKASKMVDVMMELDVYPDPYTYTVVVSGLSIIEQTKRTMQLLSLISERENATITETYYIVLEKLRKERIVEDAELVNKRSNTNPDAISYHVLLLELCNKGDIDKARRLFYLMLNDMNRRDIDDKSVNALIYGLSKANRLKEAVDIYQLLKEKLGSGNEIATSILLDSILKSGDVEKAIELWKHDSKMAPDAVTYSTMIDGFCHIGMLNIAKGLFSKMKRCGLQPLGFAYDNLITSSLYKERSS